jgi:Bacterial type II and III secretion system protein
MPGMTSYRGIQFTVALLSLMLDMPPMANTQSRPQIKVLVESHQSGTQSQAAVQGSGSVIIRRGNVYPSGRVTGSDRQTTVQRSTGIFTLVQDGGESILTVASQVPYSQAAYYYNYAVGGGYIQRQIVFTNVGTSLRVSANALPNDQIRVRLTPRISYFSSERSSTIDFTEATTELIVPSGQPVSLGGSTTQIHEITWQILGYRDRASSSESNLVLTATLQ